MNGQVAVQSAPPRILEFWGGGGGAAGGGNGRRAIERAHCITRRIKQDGSLSGP